MDADDHPDAVTVGLDLVREDDLQRQRLPSDLFHHPGAATPVDIHVRPADAEPSLEGLRLDDKDTWRADDDMVDVGA